MRREGRTSCTAQGLVDCTMSRSDAARSPAGWDCVLGPLHQRHAAEGGSSLAYGVEPWGRGPLGQAATKDRSSSGVWSLARSKVAVGMGTTHAPQDRAANPPEPSRAIKAQPHPAPPGHPTTYGSRLNGGKTEYRSPTRAGLLVPSPAPLGRTTTVWPEGLPADRSESSDQNAHLNQ